MPRGSTVSPVLSGLSYGAYTVLSKLKKASCQEVYVDIAYKFQFYCNSTSIYNLLSRGIKNGHIALTDNKYTLTEEGKKKLAVTRQYNASVEKLLAEEQRDGNA